MELDAAVAIFGFAHVSLHTNLPLADSTTRLGLALLPAEAIYLSCFETVMFQDQKAVLTATPQYQ